MPAAGGPVRRLLSSPRRRRRLARLAIALVLAAGAAVAGIWFSNTGHTIPNTLNSEKPTIVGPPPPRVPLTAADRAAARVVAARFIDGAVLRKNSADSWEVTAPTLRAGFSRARWSTGAIPVVPYPAQAVLAIKYRVEYSEANELWLKVAIVPKPSSNVDGQLFSMGLERTRSALRPWLVDYWTPAGVGVSTPQKQAAREAAIAAAEESTRASAAWIALPVGMFVALMLSVPITLLARGWVRSRRANRAYRADF